VVIKHLLRPKTNLSRCQTKHGLKCLTRFWLDWVEWPGWPEKHKKNKLNIKKNSWIKRIKHITNEHGEHSSINLATCNPNQTKPNFKQTKAWFYSQTCMDQESSVKNIDYHSKATIWSKCISDNQKKSRI